MSEHPPEDIFGPGTPGVQSGTVAQYDADRGLGVVENAAADRWMFHCTSIADGSREIGAGERVSFVVRDGGPGRFEAFDVRPAAPA